MEMPEAWKVTFRVDAPGRSFEGEISDETTTVRSDPQHRSCGFIDVVSAQPYEDDAVAEARVRARHICRRFTAVQGVQYVPTLDSTSPLRGSKRDSHSQTGLRVSDFATAHLSHNLAVQDFWLSAADALAEDPELVSAIDTYTIALGQ